MAQRYRPGVAHDRMALGACPECGRAPEMHGNDPRFWSPDNIDCDLREDGVRERIQQYEDDEDARRATDYPPDYDRDRYPPSPEGPTP
jgi:hypothetical protein